MFHADIFLLLESVSQDARGWNGKVGSAVRTPDLPLRGLVRVKPEGEVARILITCTGFCARVCVWRRPWSWSCLDLRPPCREVPPSSVKHVEACSSDAKMCANNRAFLRCKPPGNVIFDSFHSLLIHVRVGCLYPHVKPLMRLLSVRWG